MDIKCIYYSVFDPLIGPTLAHQIPEGFIPDETFATLQSFFIPDKDLCGKLTALSLKPDLCLISLPVDIVNKKYNRGSFEFNFGMVVTETCFHRLPTRVMLEQILRKMAFYLCSIELENETLSAGTTSNLYTQQSVKKLQSQQNSDNIMIDITSSAADKTNQSLTGELKSTSTDFLVPFMEELFQKLIEI